MRYPKAVVAEQAERFRKVLADIPVVNGRKVVYGLVAHVSASGMSRRFRFLAPGPDGGLTTLTYTMAVLQGANEDTRGFRIDGCGMDMGFAAFHYCMHAAFGAHSVEAREWQKSFRLEYL